MKLRKYAFQKKFGMREWEADFKMVFIEIGSVTHDDATNKKANDRILLLFTWMFFVSFQLKFFAKSRE